MTLIPSAPHDGVATGPTWMKTEEGEWHLPKLTLGWDVVAWSSTTLLQPDGPNAGQQWVWTNEQLRFLLWWYAVDEFGRFSYRRGVMRRLKGAGKDPFAAALALCEFLGPCRFGGWTDEGEPIAVPHPAPWIQIAAVNLDQTRTTMSLFPGFLGSKKRAKEMEVDLGKEIIYGPRSARIEAVTSSPRALEGSRPSLVILNETHHWIESNDGVAMSQAIARNLAKSRDGSGRALALTNAHEPGERSVAERDYEAHLAIESGKTRSEGFLYDSLEAPVGTELSDVESLRAGLTAARGDATWLDVERLIEEIMDPTTPATMSARFYLNQVVAADDSWIDPQDWAKCAVKDQLVPGDTITLFFDGSMTEDHTAIVACRVEDGLLSVLGHFDPKDEPGGEINREKVRRKINEAFTVYDVVAFYADVRFWDSEVDMWRDQYGDRLLVKATTGDGKRSHPVAWDMRVRVAEFTRAVEKFEALVTNGEVMHDGNRQLALHVSNAKRRPNRYGYTLRKEHRVSVRKIDLAVCAVGALLARWDVMATGALGKRRVTSGSVYAF